MDADLYVPGDGWLHRTDPRVKFLISIVMLALLCFVWRNWAFILGILILEHVMLATDRVPAERIGWVWKILAVLIVFIVVLWPVFDQSGTHVLWQWGWLRLTQENLLMAAVMGLRIPALGFACFLTLFTTSEPSWFVGLPPGHAVQGRTHARRNRYATFSVLLHLPIRISRATGPRTRSERAKKAYQVKTQRIRTLWWTGSNRICPSSSPY